MLIKTNSEVEKIRISCKLLAEVKKIVFTAIRPGISLKDLDSIAFKETIKRSATPAFLGYHGFPATVCASLNEELIHGIPNDRILKDGDLISIDLGLIYQGYYSDSAFTKAVGKPDEEDLGLISVAKESFKMGLKAIKPGARVGDISFAIGNYIKQQGYFTPKEFSGHGIGTKLHEEPYVYNEGKPGTGLLLKDNMVLCIEPMILQASRKIKILKDGWTVVSSKALKSSHYENTVLIKNGKGIVLTYEKEIDG